MASRGDWSQFGPGSYVYDHEHDENAHEAMRKALMLSYESRLGSLERFKEQAKGGFLTLSALLGGGLLVLVAHVIGLPI